MTNDNKINLINPVSKTDNLLDASVRVTGEFGEPRGTRLHEGIDYAVINKLKKYFLSQHMGKLIF